MRAYRQVYHSVFHVIHCTRQNVLIVELIRLGSSQIDQEKGCTLAGFNKILGIKLNRTKHGERMHRKELHCLIRKCLQLLLMNQLLTFRLKIYL